MRIAYPSTINYPIPYPAGIQNTAVDIHLAIAKGLAERGHQVTIFCSSDSTIEKPLLKASCDLPSVYWQRQNHPDKEFDGQYWSMEEHIALSYAYERANAGEFDLVWHGYPFWAASYLRFSRVPTLFTLHDAPMESYNLLKAVAHYPNHSYISISKAQQHKLPELYYRDTIYHGVDESLIPFTENPENYVVFFGRLIKEKGVVESIRVALKAGITIKVIGRFSSKLENAEYTNALKELFELPGVEYLGSLSKEELLPIVSKAKAFVNMVNIHESFGMVLIEAMAAGTPVIARNRGAISEVVQEGRTGFVIETENEAVAALQKINQIDRRYCRAYVSERFSLRKEIQEYERVMQDIILGN